MVMIKMILGYLTVGIVNDLHFRYKNRKSLGSYDKKIFVFSTGFNVLFWPIQLGFWGVVTVHNITGEILYKVTK